MTTDQFDFLITMLGDLRLIIGAVGALNVGLLVALCAIAGWKR